MHLQVNTINQSFIIAWCRLHLHFSRLGVTVPPGIWYGVLAPENEQPSSDTGSAVLFNFYQNIRDISKVPYITMGCQLTGRAAYFSNCLGRTAGVSVGTCPLVTNTL